MLPRAHQARRERLLAQARSAVGDPFLLDGRMARRVATRKGEAILIDAEDAERVRDRVWYLNVRGYAASGCGANSSIMHRLLMDAPPGTMLDHINGNRADNRKSNLRFVTNQQNMQNVRAARRDSKTGVRGVSHCERGRFEANVSVLGKRHCVGRFDTIEEADSAVRAARARLMTHAPECARG